MQQRKVVLQLQHESFASRYQLASMAITSAAAGDETWVVLWFGALQRWMEGRFDEALAGEEEGIAARLRELNLPPPGQMLEEARSLGARIVACETGVRLAGLDPEQLGALVDHRPGLQEILEAAKEASLSLYL